MPCKENLSEHKGHILQTCSDCLLWTDTFRNEDVTGRYIMQFSKFGTLLKYSKALSEDANVLIAHSSASVPFPARTGKIDPKDVETIKKQAECLNFPEDFHSYDGKTGQL